MEHQEGPSTLLCLLLWIDPLSHTGAPRETRQPSLPPHPAQRLQAGWRETPKCLAPTQAHAKMEQLPSSLEQRIAMLSKEVEEGQGVLKAGSRSSKRRQAAV